MFPTKAVRKLKYTVCSKTFFRKPCRLLDNVEKYDRARRTRDGSIIRCKIGVICMPGSWDKSTDTYLLLLTSVRNISQFDNGTRGTPNTLILFTATSTTVTIKRERIVAFHGNNGYAMHHNVRLYVVPIWLVLKKMRSVWGEWDHKAPQHVFKQTANNTGHWPLKSGATVGRHAPSDSAQCQRTTSKSTAPLQKAWKLAKHGTFKSSVSHRAALNNQTLELFSLFSNVSSTTLGHLYVMEDLFAGCVFMFSFSHLRHPTLPTSDIWQVATKEDPSLVWPNSNRFLRYYIQFPTMFSKLGLQVINTRPYWEA